MKKVESGKIVNIRSYRRRMKLDQFTFHHVLAETTGISIVMFSKNGCNSCKAWKRLLEQYQREHPEVAIFEVDAESEMALAQEFDVSHLPALFLYNDGQFHHEIQCTASPITLKMTIADLLTKPAQEQP